MPKFVHFTFLLRSLNWKVFCLWNGVYIKAWQRGLPDDSFPANTCISFKIRFKQKTYCFCKLWVSRYSITLSVCFLFVFSLNCDMKQLIETPKQFKSTLYGFKDILSDFFMHEFLMRFSVKNTEKVCFPLIYFKSLSKSYYYFSLKWFFVASFSYIYDLSLNWIVYFLIFFWNVKGLLNTSCYE